MGTHPIFESDFDCLTEMASGKLYTYPDNFRADKIRAVAQISGYNLSLAPEYVHGVTNKTEEFQSKFFGKVPAFESGETCLCDDTAIAHFIGNAQTRGGDSTHDVICWAGLANTWHCAAKQEPRERREGELEGSFCLHEQRPRRTDVPRRRTNHLRRHHRRPHPSISVRKCAYTGMARRVFARQPLVHDCDQPARREVCGWRRQALRQGSSVRRQKVRRSLRQGC